MKVFFSLVIAILLSQATTFASPLLNYTEGKGSIDLSLRNSDVTTITTASEQWKKKYNFEGTLTLGISNKFAFQYRYYEPQTADTIINFGFGPNDCKEKVKADEFNILYKINNNISAIGGVILGKEYVTDMTNPFFSDVTATKKLLQVGLIASTPIAAKTTLWGSLAGNNDLTNYEIGLGYAISPNFDFNVYYRGLDAKSSDGETKVKGLGFGISYKY